MNPLALLSEHAAPLGISPRLLGGLQEQEVETLLDLLHWYPRRWEDRRQFDSWPNQPSEQPQCLHARIVDQRSLRLGGKRHLLELTLEAAANEPAAPNSPPPLLETPVIARFFNLRWLAKTLPVGLELILWGKVKAHGERLVIDHPEYEAIEGDRQSPLHLGRIVPIYPTPGALQQRPLRAAMARALKAVDGSELPPLRAKALESTSSASSSGSSFANQLATLEALHFPVSLEQQQSAREQLAAEEFLRLHLRVLARRQQQQALHSPPRRGAGKLLAQLLEQLPFEPTQAQERSIAEIAQDLAQSRPMSRLLQGDVGSGKTLVAAAAAALVIETGWQVALLAPTQILAEQHFQSFSKWFRPLGISVSLRTRSQSLDSQPVGFGSADKVRQQAGVKESLFPTQAGLVIGTHALFEDKVSLPKLGLVIIDEQHKFGVEQRERLLQKGQDGGNETHAEVKPLPDLLVMTATPIPRTLCLTHYGDLELSLLDESPANRGKAITRVRLPKTRKQAAAFLREKLAEGRQAYLVYPLIEESDAIKAASAEDELPRWQKELKGFQVGLLHGRLSAEEKARVMEQFRAREIHALVCTTVIEVGVDVPNATLMYIWNAERFGLAQLHQLRGRVRRSEHTGYCVLFSDAKKHPEAQEKLQVMEELSDGFQLAEADLRLRGAGELLGIAQSGGTQDLRLGDLVKDAELVRETRKLAEEIFAQK